MSYIRAEKITQGTVKPIIDMARRGTDGPTLDADMDFEMLGFVLGLISEIDNLGEGEALVVWKEIF